MSLNNPLEVIQEHMFKRITPYNGFDSGNPDNARQNNYAWSMAELGGYIYVGTARNIPYSTIAYYFGPELAPEVFVPQHVDMDGEIWRYRKDGSEGWERVYKTPTEFGSIGFRFMATYTSPKGETAIYAGPMTLTPNIILIKSTDGVNWTPLFTGITTGNSTRSMAEHEGRLYMAVLAQFAEGSKTYLYVSTDPEGDGWELIDLEGDPGKNPRGGADILLGFNGHLYVMTELPGGFEVWRTRGSTPQKDDWKLVVDKGAGDAQNQVACSAGVFKEHIYIGSALWAAITSLDPQSQFTLPKGFDLIRVDREDRWELVAGGPPIVPTEPTTGNRGLPVSGRDSGFGDLTNAYCWQVQAHGGEIYIGSFNWSVLVPAMASPVEEYVEKNLSYDLGNYLTALENYLRFIFRNDLLFNLIPVEQALKMAMAYLAKKVEKTFGFDLWKSRDGVHWVPVTLDGLNNQYNYGVRMLFVDSDDRFYLGSANPFQGCEVWVRG